MRTGKGAPVHFIHFFFRFLVIIFGCHGYLRSPLCFSNRRVRCTTTTSTLSFQLRHLSFMAHKVSFFVVYLLYPGDICHIRDRKGFAQLSDSVGTRGNIHFFSVSILGTTFIPIRGALNFPQGSAQSSFLSNGAYPCKYRSFFTNLS